MCLVSTYNILKLYLFLIDIIPPFQKMKVLVQSRKVCHRLTATLF